MSISFTLATHRIPAQETRIHSVFSVTSEYDLCFTVAEELPVKSRECIVLIRVDVVGQYCQINHPRKHGCSNKVISEVETYTSLQNVLFS
jgi:hypothetical protein